MLRLHTDFSKEVTKTKLDGPFLVGVLWEILHGINSKNVDKLFSFPEISMHKCTDRWRKLH